MGVDMLSLAGHKFYAPKGIGVLYCRRGIKLSRMLHGAEHEQGMRAGTENIMGIAGIGKAAELVSREFGGANAALTATSHEPQAISHEFFQAAPNRSAVTVKDLRDRLHHSISEVFPLSRLNGHPVKRLPNTLSLGFRGQDASVLLNEWKGLAASAGAACHAGLETISAVLLAMNVPREYALGTIRFSLGRMTTAKDIETATGIITEWAGRKQGSVIFHAMPFAARDSKEDGPEIKRTEAQDDPGHREFRHMDSPVNPLSTDDLAAAERPLPPEAGPPGGIRLTAFTHSLGCACKIKPQSLEKILKAIPVPDDKSVLVGTETSDDAAVYLFSRNKAIVQTVDFIPPVVDDPYHYGAIASANALSDVYAMGGKPLFALSIVAFPEKLIPYEVLGEIIRGATDKVREAGISIIGGHSIEDEEPKFGLVVCGEVNPGKIWKNSTPRSGDVLVLTKPLGTGIITTAIKRKYAGEAAAAEAVAVMSTLNKYAAEILMKYDVHACTDITGFGLLGHLKEMLSAGNLDAEISWQTVPLLTEAMNYAVAGMIPGGTRNNLEFVKKHLRIRDDVPALVKILFSDAQTSGGLLVSLPEEDAMKALPELARRGIVQAGMIGRVVPGDSSIVIR
jgi:selenium donor protein